ncbi:unnamed protein product [Pleuronectes platessa]|uniref:Uncharacterized protein n=1 Tax=Pleuronectes platessa TaxID=8262 RepID=A0A9N7VPD7_PLEPL|nr:unnamed protein product [Pleuronectes platessa]
MKLGCTEAILGSRRPPLPHARRCAVSPPESIQTVACGPGLDSPLRLRPTAGRSKDPPRTMPFHAGFIFLWFSLCFLWKMEPVCSVYTAGWKTRPPDLSKHASEMERYSTAMAADRDIDIGHQDGMSE